MAAQAIVMAAARYCAWAGVDCVIEMSVSTAAGSCRTGRAGSAYGGGRGGGRALSRRLRRSQALAAQVLLVCRHAREEGRGEEAH